RTSFRRPFPHHPGGPASRGRAPCPASRRPRGRPPRAPGVSGPGDRRTPPVASGPWQTPSPPGGRPPRAPAPTSSPPPRPTGPTWSWATTGGPAAGGAPATRCTSPTTTRSGAAPCATSAPCSACCAWRRSSPGCRGSPSCASARPSWPPSTGSTPRSWPATARPTSPGSWPTPASCATGPRFDAAIANARAVVAMHDRGETLVDVVFGHAPPPDERPPGRYARLADLPAATPSSTALARDLRRRGFRFVGPVVAYSLMQAAGVVDDHLAGCWVAGELDAGGG